MGNEEVSLEGGEISTEKKLNNLHMYMYMYVGSA